MQTKIQLDVVSVSKLTNLNEINRLLNETVAREHAIDSNLEKVLAKRAAIDRSLLHTKASTTEVLEFIKTDAEQLAASVNATSQLSEKVSRKVRELDTAQSRVSATLSRINLTVDRTACIDGIRQALDSLDYEAAAGHVETFLELERQFGPYKDDVDSKQALEQRDVMLAAKARLEVMVEQKLDEAESNLDHDSVLRFTCLSIPLGQSEQGLARFIAYLRRLIADRASSQYSALVESSAAAKGPDTDFAAALTNLFRDVATALDENEVFLTSTFGAPSVLEVGTALQEECDAHGARILKRYMQTRKLAEVANELGPLRRAEQRSEAAFDPRQAEGFLEEMLVLCQSTEEYNQYMLARMASATPSGALSASQETVFRSGGLNIAVRELVAYYINLEEFYLEESVEKAIRIDTATRDALTSSMVDDTFFLLQKCGSRALATRNLQCVCAILGQLNSILASAYKQALDAKLKGAGARLLANSPALDHLSPDAITARTQAAAAFNNAETSSSYVLKLRRGLEESTSGVFTAPHDRDRTRSVLADLSKTASDFKQATARALEQLASSIMPQLRPILDEVAGVQYELSEAQYAANEVGETWVQQLLGAFVDNLQWLAPLLTPGNYDTLLHQVIDKVVARCEAIMMHKRFNQLGGLQLDRDTRLLVGALSELSNRTVRDKFARLTQMATILSLESVEEVLDYWGENSGPITWRLTELDVRQVLRQRSDFLPEDIAALSL